MLTKAATSALFVLFLYFGTTASAQSIETSTVNMGGGFYTGANYLFDWSIGEGASIETFQSPNLLVTSGVLQPLTERLQILDNLTLPWLKNEIAVFPVPTHNVVEVEIKIFEKGPVTIQLLDQRARIIETRTFNYTGASGTQKIDLRGLTSGVYYLNVVFGGKSAFPVIRNGTFKIQKL